MPRDDDNRNTGTRLNMVGCPDGAERHWYEAFPRPYWSTEFWASTRIRYERFDGHEYDEEAN